MCKYVSRVRKLLIEWTRATDIAICEHIYTTSFAYAHAETPLPKHGANDRLRDQTIFGHNLTMIESKFVLICHRESQYSEAFCGANTDIFPRRLAPQELATFLFFAFHYKSGI